MNRIIKVLAFGPDRWERQEEWKSWELHREWGHNEEADIALLSSEVCLRYPDRTVSYASSTRRVLFFRVARPDGKFHRLVMFEFEPGGS